MGCTNCGSDSQTRERTFRFQEAEKEIQLTLCSDCSDALSSEEGVKLVDE